MSFYYTINLLYKCREGVYAFSDFRGTVIENYLLIFMISVLRSLDIGLEPAKQFNKILKILKPKPNDRIHISFISRVFRKGKWFIITHLGLWTEWNNLVFQVFFLEISKFDRFFLQKAVIPSNDLQSHLSSFDFKLNTNKLLNETT